MKAMRLIASRLRALEGDFAAGTRTSADRFHALRGAHYSALGHPLDDFDCPRLDGLIVNMAHRISKNAPNSSDAAALEVMRAADQGKSGITAEEYLLVRALIISDF